ncbi:MAG: D-alanyl-D-alanine carboxypeptidase family protein [Alphaproteobacteria bacterium]
MSAPASLAQVGFQSKAKFAILMDGDSKAILYKKNIDTLMNPASMSKLMTAVMVFEGIQNGDLALDEEFFVSENAWRKGGVSSGSSTMFAKLNSSIALEDLLRGVIVQSGNDASIVIAEGMFGTEEAFAEAMTARARELGLRKSTFTNATGWPDPDHKMTTRELALLARHIIYNLPEFYKYYSEQDFTWNGIKQRNRNPLLTQNVGVDGLKTGYVKESGYGLVASAMRKGRRLIAVVHGLKRRKDRGPEMRKLLDWGFRSFKRFVLFEAGEEIGTASVWGGAQGSVPLVAKGAATISVQRMSRSKIKAKIVYQGPLRAPVAEGDQVATLMVTAAEAGTAEIPLYAAQDVAPGTFSQKALDALGSLILGRFKALY